MGWTFGFHQQSLPRPISGKLITRPTLESKNESVRVEIQLGYQDKDPFHIMYDMVNNLSTRNEEKIYLGNKNDKKCRFCQKDNSETKFNNKAHIIPEFMGNKAYFSYFECDSCNEYFSRYETALSSYGGILNTFSKVKGKKGYPKHKGINEQTETIVENDNIMIRINDPLGDSEENSKKSIIYNKEKKVLTFNTNKCSYVPMDAYKALIKIGFCMLNHETLSDYETTRNWLLGKEELNIQPNNPLYCIYQKIGGRLFPHPWAVLMEKKKEFYNTPCPTHSFLLFYGLFAFQIFIPGNVKDDWIWKEDRVILPIENHISLSEVDSNGKVKLGVDRIDFSSKELIKNPEHIFRACLNLVA